MEKEVAFSTFLKQKRLKKGLGLREFARIIKMQPSNYCSIESGSLSPLLNKVEEMAIALGLKKGGRDYYKFMDLASKTTDDIPPDIRELIKTNSLIPSMLRTIEGCELKPVQLGKIIEDIRSGRYKDKTANKR